MSKKSKIERARAKNLKENRHRNFYWELHYRSSGISKSRGNLLRMANRRVNRFRSKVDFNRMCVFVPVKQWAGIFLTTKRRSCND